MGRSTGVGTLIKVVSVTVIAALHTSPDLAIAAGRGFTGTQARIGLISVLVVAVLLAGLDLAIAAGRG